MKSFKQSYHILTITMVVMLSLIPYGCFETPGDGEGDAIVSAPASDPGTQPVVTSATVFQQNDSTQTPIAYANIGDNVAFNICITDPDLDASQVTITHYLQPDLVNPYFAPETVTLAAQTSASQCYPPILTTIAGPAGTWVVTVDVSDAQGNVSGPTFMSPTGFTVNPTASPTPTGTQPVVTSATVFQQNDSTQTPIASADIGDNVAFDICITDPDLDASQVTVTQYLQPDLVNPYFAPETVTLAAQTSASQCYPPILTTIAGPAGTWVITVDVSDAQGNVSGPTYMSPTGFTVNPTSPLAPTGTQPAVTSVTVFQQNDPTQTAITSADIGDYVAFNICITDPDLDASQVTITHYLQPDLVNPNFAPETLTLAAQTTASQCYIDLQTIAGPSGTWVITVDVSDALGNVSGPTYMSPIGFIVN